MKLKLKYRKKAHANTSLQRYTNTTIFLNMIAETTFTIKKLNQRNQQFFFLFSRLTIFRNFLSYANGIN